MLAAALIAAVAVVYILAACMFITAGRADRNAPRPPRSRDHYEEAA